MEFGEQLKDVLAILDELQLETEERPKGRSWNWLKFWRHINVGKSNTNLPDTGKHTLLHLNQGLVTEGPSRTLSYQFRWA